MHDPHEGVTPDGMIRTGARRDRVPAAFEPVLAAVMAEVRQADENASLYVYGSVATGSAEPGHSDVDLLTIGLGSGVAAELGRDLSAAFASRCRAVEIAAAKPGDFAGEGDAAHGGRVFLRHYCVHLTGPDRAAGLPDFPADARAARGFNGDIGEHAARWRQEVDDGADPVALGRRIARKTLLAVAGLVSVHDTTWTTDREQAARRWGEVEPDFVGDLATLLAWSRDEAAANRVTVATVLEGVVTDVVAAFRESIGLWRS